MARGIGIALVGLSVQLVVIAMVLAASSAGQMGQAAFVFSLMGLALVIGGAGLEISDRTARMRA